MSDANNPGQRVSFQCRANGDPQPSVSLSKEGQVITTVLPGQNRTATETYLQHDIPDFQCPMIGEYTCTATSVAGTQNETRNVGAGIDQQKCPDQSTQQSTLDSTPSVSTSTAMQDLQTTTTAVQDIQSSEQEPNLTSPATTQLPASNQSAFPSTSMSPTYHQEDTSASTPSGMDVSTESEEPGRAGGSGKVNVMVPLVTVVALVAVLVVMAGVLVCTIRMKAKNYHVGGRPHDQATYVNEGAEKEDKI